MLQSYLSKIILLLTLFKWMYNVSSTSSSDIFFCGFWFGTLLQLHASSFSITAFCSFTCLLNAAIAASHITLICGMRRVIIQSQSQEQKHKETREKHMKWKWKSNILLGTRRGEGNNFLTWGWNVNWEILVNELSVPSQEKNLCYKMVHVDSRWWWWHS